MPFKNPHPLYSTWQNMLRRCDNKKNKQYKDYGGRGITVCERWKTFSNFVADMGSRPIGYSIDRKNNDGNYEPSNCRWVSKKAQQRNQRANIKVVIDGDEYLACELADLSGVKTDTIISRVARGLTYEQVISRDKGHDISGFSLGGFASGAKKQAMTHCKNGHEFTPQNTAITKEGWRRCKRCHADRQLARAKRLQSVVSS